MLTLQVSLCGPKPRFVLGLENTIIIRLGNQSKCNWKEEESDTRRPGNPHSRTDLIAVRIRIICKINFIARENPSPLGSLQRAAAEMSLLMHCWLGDSCRKTVIFISAIAGSIDPAAVPGDCIVGAWEVRWYFCCTASYAYLGLCSRSGLGAVQIKVR